MNKLENFLKVCVEKGLIIDYDIVNYFDNSNIILYFSINNYNFYIQLDNINNEAPNHYYESLIKNKMGKCYNKYLMKFNFYQVGRYNLPRC